MVWKMRSVESEWRGIHVYKVSEEGVWEFGVWTVDGWKERSSFKNRTRQSSAT